MTTRTAAAMRAAGIAAAVATLAAPCHAADAAAAVEPAEPAVAATHPQTARPQTARPQTARPQTARPQIARPDASRQHALLQLLHRDCGACHGMRLTGGLGPALTPEALRGTSDDALVATILDGRPGTAMPPWRRFLSDADAAWLTERLRAGDDRVR